MTAIKVDDFQTIEAGGCLSNTGIAYQTQLKAKKIKGNELNILTKNIKEFNLKINDTNSFDRAQVSAGGVSTREINPQNMESKIIKNLYFAGELVDVDGTCGGYNLQWAWSSGYVAGRG